MSEDDHRPLKTSYEISLPSGTAAPLTYDPALASVSIPPRVERELGDASGLLEFPVVTAGMYAVSPLTDALCRLSGRSRAALRAFVAGERSVESTAAVLVETGAVCRLLHRAYAPAVRTLVEWSLERLLSNNGFLDLYAADYAADNPAADKHEIRTAWRRLETDVTDGYADSEFGAMLDDLSQTYSRRVAAIVSKLALQPNVSVTDDTVIDRIGDRVLSCSLAERHRRLGETVKRCIDAPTELEERRLRQQIIESSDQSFRRVSTRSERGPTLVEAPRRVQDRHSLTSAPGELTGYPTGIAWLLTKAFTEGNIGCVIYPRQSGQRGRLANPWVESVESYRSVWNEAFVTDHAVTVLLEQASRVPAGVDSIRCPLCVLSTERCNGGRCGWDEFLGAVRSAHTQLCDELTAQQADLESPYAEVFENG